MKKTVENFTPKLDKANTIYDMVYFKETGAYNKLMEEQYTEKVKQYLISYKEGW